MATNWLRGSEDEAQKRKRILLQVAGRGEALGGGGGRHQRGTEGHRNFRSVWKKDER
jgi:hypothetical protein